MEQAPIPNLLSQNNTNKQKRKLPTPQELVSHYESKGMDSQQASMKVVEDLQNALFRVVSSNRGKKDRLLADSSRKLDATNSRLALLDTKVDSKPGYAETFAIGLASGAALKGLCSVWPHLLGAFGQIWSSATSVTKRTL